MTTRRKIDEAATEAEASADQPMPPAPAPAPAPSRPNKSIPVAVRLAPDDVSAIEELAASLNVPASTLIRGWIHQGLAARRETSVNAALDQLTADVQRLRELVV